MNRITVALLVFFVLSIAEARAGHVEGYGHSDVSAASWGDASLDGWSATNLYLVPLDSGDPDERFGSVVDQPILYHAQPREDVDSYRVFPLLAVSDGGNYEIIGYGSGHEPVVSGLNSFVPTWTGVTDFETGFPGLTFHVGFAQTRIGIDNSGGGIISFDNSGGLGLIQQDDNTRDPDWTPSIGPWSTGHTTAAGGRDYQYIQAIQWSSGIMPVSCDFDGDAACTVVDVDMLVGEIIAGTNRIRFDINSDGVVNQDDLNQWLSDAATANGKGAPYLVGDANLDGKVDAPDLNALGSNWQGSPNTWSAGDFNASGTVDAADLNPLGINWQQMIPMPAAAESVPEPSTLLLMLGIVGLSLVGRARYVRRFRESR